MDLISRRPMGREDWAWVLAGVIGGLFLAACAILPEVSNGEPRHLTNYDYATGKWVDSTAPAYTKRLTIETNGDIQKMVQAVHDIDPDCYTLPSRDNPKLMVSDYGEIIFVGIFAGVMISMLFHIVVKISRKIVGVKTPSDEIVRDPSTPLRSAQDDGLKI